MNLKNLISTNKKKYKTWIQPAHYANVVNTLHFRFLIV